MTTRARPIGINLTKSPSTSVGARVVRSGVVGLDGRPLVPPNRRRPLQPFRALSAAVVITSYDGGEPLLRAGKEYVGEERYNSLSIRVVQPPAMRKVC